MRLPGGSSILLYTDGLLEAYADDSVPDSIGIDELVTAIGSGTSGGEPVRTWIPELVGRAPRESIDDTTIVVLTVN